MIINKGAYPTRMPSSISVGETFSPKPTTNYKHTTNNLRDFTEHYFTAQCLQSYLLLNQMSHTFAICLTFMTYLESSVPGFIILVQRATCQQNIYTFLDHILWLIIDHVSALCFKPHGQSISIQWFSTSIEHNSIIMEFTLTCNGCSSCIICLSETRSHWLGAARPVSDSLMPVKKVNIYAHTTSCLKNQFTNVKSFYILLWERVQHCTSQFCDKISKHSCNMHHLSKS